MLDGFEADYIICGGGTSGCLIASRIITSSNASVLVVEAGRDSNVASDVLVPGKYVHQLSADKEGLWQLPTVPQEELNGRQILFLRGKQLGGSSAVNYMALARGPADDYDEWARLTGDENWKWSNVLPMMKQLEDFRPSRPRGFEHLANPNPSDHGIGGPIMVGFGDEMTPGVETFFNACKEVGMNVCVDNNSGNPVGVGLAQFNTGNGIRSYAANAFLDSKVRSQHSRLRIRTHTIVRRILFDSNSRAVGVELSDAHEDGPFQIRFRKEVILCSGTFGSPQTLMLSGIGPRKQLEAHNIPIVLDVPSVGENMLDHSILTLEYRVDDNILAHNQIFANPELLAEADAMYAKDKSGPHNVFGTNGSVAFPKIERLLTSPEFEKLNSYQKQFMSEKTRPSAEIWLGSGPSAYTGEIRPEQSYMSHELLLQNNLSRGVVRLKSSDPRDRPMINPRFLQHAYDKRIAIETVREAMRIGGSQAYQGTVREMVHGPSGDDDESILRFVRANLGQGYHSLGTCKMGSSKDMERVVDPDFKVVGVEGLRVADLSVCPILTCNHTQINAYLIGEMCARKMLSLGRRKR